MAQIVKKSSALQKKYEQKKTLAIVALAVALVCFIVCMVLTSAFYLELNVPLLFGVVGGFLFGGVMLGKARALRSGLEGEGITAAMLAALPSSYIVFQNVEFVFDGWSNELDAVVVGPTGVFVIETKYRNGTILGSYEGKEWVQRKIGQQGTPYSREFFSPITQVRRQVHCLAGLLKENGIDVYVNGMVYFANPDTIVKLEGTPSKTPVFTAGAHSGAEIRGYITAASKTALSHDEIMRIADVLNRHP